MTAGDSPPPGTENELGATPTAHSQVHTLPMSSARHSPETLPVGTRLHQPPSGDSNLVNVPKTRQWGVKTGASIGPPIIGHTSAPSSPDTETARPGSIPPTPPAITAYVSSDEDTGAITPVDPSLKEPDVVRQPQITEQTPCAEAAPPQKPTINDVEADGVSIAQGSESARPRRHNRYRGPGAAGAWWKKDPHPAYRYEFADRRLRVT